MECANIYTIYIYIYSHDVDGSVDGEDTDTDNDNSIQMTINSHKNFFVLHNTCIVF